MREEKERLKGDVEELRRLSNKLQEDIQQVAPLELTCCQTWCFSFLILNP